LTVTPGQLFSPLVEEWRRNQRFRIGALMVSGILIFYVFLVMSDANQANRRGYEDLIEKMTRIEPANEKELWSRRQEDAKKLFEALEAQYWRANSRGMARAMVQAWIDQLLREYRFTAPRARVDAPVDVPNTTDLWEIVVTIDADAGPENLHELLRVVETYPKFVSIEKLFVTEHGMEFMDQKRFTLILKAYFKAETSESS
jgi:hypothetical protein